MQLQKKPNNDQEEKKEHRTVTVGLIHGLSVDNRDLQNAFSTVGEVISVKTNTRDKVTEIEYRDEKQAKEAVRRFNGGKLNDRIIDVYLPGEPPPKSTDRIYESESEAEESEESDEDDEEPESISDSSALVRFYDTNGPIHVHEVPKHKLVLTKGLKTTNYNNKLGILLSYDIKTDRMQVAFGDEKKTCLIRPGNLSLDMNTWPKDITVAALGALKKKVKS